MPSETRQRKKPNNPETNQSCNLGSPSLPYRAPHQIQAQPSVPDVSAAATTTTTTVSISIQSALLALEPRPIEIKTQSSASSST
jgi:hypothetical protein